MKRLLLISLLLVCFFSSLALAEGTYEIYFPSDTDVRIEFVPGPFGPGEGGVAYLYIDDVLCIDDAGNPIPYPYWRIDDKHPVEQTTWQGD